MKMKKTILSKKDLEILEKIIAYYGNIVGFDQIESLLADYSYYELVTAQ